MTKNLLTSAVFAGVVARAGAALLHSISLTLLEGELFGTSARIHLAQMDHHKATVDRLEWAVISAVICDRRFSTFGGYVGFGFLLL
jgi:hypothetical protein